MTNLVWVLSIDHRYGTDITLFGDHEKALSVLDGYVVEHWPYEIKNEPMPDTAESRIAQYFDSDNLHGESYAIDPKEVQ